MKHKLSYDIFISREYARKHPKTLFVFGDNLEHQGLGGQAREMRGEPNAVGIPTKRSPSMRCESFFTDADIGTWMKASAKAFQRIVSHPGPIVWPTHGIGTGRAKLRESSPLIWALLETFRKHLEQVQIQPTTLIDSDQ